MKDIVLLDGGVGQEVYKRAGKPANPMWSSSMMMSRPEIVKEVHREFINAGAKVITVNSYSSTPTRLKRDGKPEWFEELQTQALTLASEARDELGDMASDVQIAGCLPPLIASYTSDERPFSEIKKEYEQIVAIQKPSVDLFLIETISNIKEAQAAIEVAAQTGKKVLMSFTLEDNHSNQLRSGETIEEALRGVKQYPPDALLFNCSFPESIGEGIKALGRLDKPFGGYANGFTSVEPLKPGKTVDLLSARHDMHEEKYAQHAMDWVKAGATIIGGCCEVGPSHIDYLRRQLQEQGYNIVPFQ
ncbi:MAG: homocysteine S-methyltransferase family protein [Bacteroidales bacterium]|nr:homocysteine S-methyltransferase family protein [Bacteroidales bacterium]MCF8333184.1 homocysteine S-methyltransferase family protein [Bacteroidales bacterium]